MARRSLAVAALVAAAQASDLEAGGPKVVATTPPPTPYSVIEMDLYGAVPSGNSPEFGIENANLMSLMGVLKHIHTDIIVEHEVSPADRTARRNSVEVINRARFRVKNPPTVVADPGRTETLVSDVDFGPYMHYQDGGLTSSFQVGLIQRHGDIVGVQEIRDERFLARDPFYWFSLSGWCPNVPDHKKPNRTWLERDANNELCQNRNNAQCDATNGTCYWEWKGDWTVSCNLGSDLIPQCGNYSNTTGAPGKIRGGLCPGGAESLTVTPTGEFGCTYSYGPLQTVSLDKLTGIVEEDCGGRKCTNWLDFRQHCTNEKYKQKFVGEVTKGAEPYDFCVEYDIHQACASSCTSKACLQLPESEREIGLPFWRGRCSAKANQVRAEKLAQAFGIHGPHRLVSKDLQTKPPTCTHRVPGFCTPAPGQGGMYCSREWGGVCQPCYIPGTVEVYQATATPLCPYDVLSLPDYKGKFPVPKCKSQRARDLCCLYTRTCEVMETDPRLAPTDDDGLALVAMNQSTDAMATFLERAAVKNGRARTMSNILNFAYFEWGSTPAKGRSLKDVFADLQAAGHILPPEETTTTRTPWVPAPIAPVPVADVPAASTSKEAGSSGMQWWAWVLILLGSVIVAVAAGLACCLFMGGMKHKDKKDKKDKKGKKDKKSKREAVSSDDPEVAAGLVASAAPAPMGAPLLQTSSAVPMATYTQVPYQVYQTTSVAPAQVTAVAPSQVTSIVAAPGSQVGGLSFAAPVAPAAPTYSYRVA